MTQQTLPVGMELSLCSFFTLHPRYMSTYFIVANVCAKVMFTISHFSFIVMHQALVGTKLLMMCLNKSTNTFIFAYPHHVPPILPGSDMCNGRRSTCHAHLLTYMDACAIFHLITNSKQLARSIKTSRYRRTHRPCRHIVCMH